MTQFRFTDRTVRYLSPDAPPRAEYFDTALHGFGLRVAPDGRRTFFVRYRNRAGRHRRFTLGVYGIVTLAQARGEARQVLAAVARGEDPAAERERTAGDTFEEVARLFLKRHAGPLRPRTAVEYRRVLEKDAIPRWGGMKAGDVQRAHVMELLDEIAHDRGSPVAANRTRAILHALFNFALARELVASNPCAGVKRPAPEPNRDRILSPAEIGQLWTALDAEAEPVRSLVRFLLLTAQRSGETCRMRWADVDAASATWAIPGPDRKGGRPHRVPLSAQARALLVGLRPVTGKSEYVFASPSPRAGGRPFRWLSHAAGRLREACAFGFRIHDLRRTAASGLSELGVDRETIKKVLGHRSADAGVIGVYDRYGREPEKRDALERWGARVELIVAGKAAERVVGRIG